MSEVKKILDSSRMIIWDFDGVIKDSVAIKGRLFRDLFNAEFGDEISNRVLQHHKAHGGVSRYEKIPLYLSWCFDTVDDALVDRYLGKFSEQTIKAVVNSNWIVGVQDYLMSNYQHKTFVLVSATPQDEIEIILAQLGIAKCFSVVYGAPAAKVDAVKECLTRINIPAEQAVFIGDAPTDYKAAINNSVPFLLRSDGSDDNIPGYTGHTIRDFCDV